MTLDYETGKKLDLIIEQNMHIIETQRSLGDMLYQLQPKQKKTKKKPKDDLDEYEQTETEEEEFRNMSK